MFMVVEQSSKFKGNVNVAMPLIPTSKVAPSTIVQFFEDFIQAVRKASEKGNELVKEVMRSGKLLANQIPSYIDEILLVLTSDHSDHYVNNELYPGIDQLMKMVLGPEDFNEVTWDFLVDKFKTIVFYFIGSFINLENIALYCLDFCVFI